jgi:adenylate kinase
MDRGELVPDTLVLALLTERLQGAEEGHAGFLLDGFPRNVSQAEALQGELGDEGVQHVVYLQLEDGEILDRLLKRGRKDDKEDVIRNRLEVYRAETEPLVAWYRDRGVLRPVDANGTVDEVHERVRAAFHGA